MQALGLLPVDRNQELGIVRGITRKESCQIFLGTRIALSHEVVGYLGQVLQRVPAQVLQFELKPAKSADAVDSGRQERDNQRPLYRKQRPLLQSIDHHLRGVFRTLALSIGL